MKKNNFSIGVFWSLIACLMSAFNDMLSKAMGLSLGGGETLFFRFFFGTLAFIPFILLKKDEVLKTPHAKIHALRGGLFALAMIPWSYGLIDLPLPLVTTISFSTPLFVVVLAGLFLKENVGLPRIIATALGFIGIMVSSGFSMAGANHFVTLLALSATVLFAALDIINKRLLNIQEGLLPLMFYSSFFAALFTLPLLFFQWTTPSLYEIGALAILGICANALLWCLLKAFEAYEISALQPFRYFEFLFSCVLSIYFFSEWPTSYIIFGFFCIVPATLYLSYHELNLDKDKDKNTNASAA